MDAKARNYGVYIGVCPRTGGLPGRTENITTARAVWCDCDHIAVDAALDRVDNSGVPYPSIVVSSGYGVHLYWLLTSPVAMATEAERKGFEAVCRGVGQRIGGDHTHDLARVMRLPGTWNCKRGASVRCCVDGSSTFDRHDLHTLVPFATEVKQPVARTVRMVRPWEGLTQRQQAATSAAIWRSEIAMVGTRSELDYATLVWCVKLGLN